MTVFYSKMPVSGAHTAQRRGRTQQLQCYCDLVISPYVIRVTREHFRNSRIRTYTRRLLLLDFVSSST